MSSPADIIRQLLIDLSLGSESGNDWPIYTGFLIDLPDNAICCYDTAGKLDGRIMQGEQIEHEGIQVRVRSSSYVEGWEKVKAIAIALDAQRRSEVSIDSDNVFLIHNISRTGSIIPLGVEETDKRRHHFTVNAITTITKES